MQVIGLCRFSYPALGGFQVDFPTMEDKLAYLYAPARMEERFRTFETITLPPLRAQTDPDFDFIVLIGGSLPEPYRLRLEALLADLPQARLVVFPPKPHREIMKRVINNVRRFDERPCLQFRMDDDDAVAVDFVERLRDLAARCAPIAADRPYLAIDFNRGFLAEPGPEGLAVAETQTPYQTAALALYASPGTHATIMSFAHNKLPQKMTTITMTDEDMLVRGYNSFNDSRQGPHVKQPRLTRLDDEGEDYFKARFNIDANAVRAAWAAPISNAVPARR